MGDKHITGAARYQKYFGIGKLNNRKKFFLEEN